MGTYGLVCPHCNKSFNSRKIVEELDAEYTRGVNDWRPQYEKAKQQLESYLQLDETRQRVFAIENSNRH